MAGHGQTFNNNIALDTIHRTRLSEDPDIPNDSKLHYASPDYFRKRPMEQY